LKALVQRVSRASVSSEGTVTGSIGKGLLVLVGFGQQDTETDLRWMARKILELRIFPDPNGDMNLSVQDVEGELLIVSQFTLHADTRKGRRPSFVKAADPSTAGLLYSLFIQMCTDAGIPVRHGSFGAMMDVELVNDGPVTIMIDSPAERARS
jgi:D-tyrosyl-tRNA(Tyr) deacylase